jgi:predicted peroxiredoxin
VLLFLRFSDSRTRREFCDFRIDIAGSGYRLSTLEASLAVESHLDIETDMASYLFIESRDTFGTGEFAFFHDLARRLAGARDQVTLFLVQNGVMPARAGAMAPSFGELVQTGVEVLADDFSLRERGISADRLQPGVKASPLDLVIDRLAEGCKAIWH